MKRNTAPNGRRHGQRARHAFEGRAEKTVLVFESAAQVYHWTTDRGRARVVVKH